MPRSPADLLIRGKPLTLAGVPDGAEGLVLADLAVAARKEASLLVVCRDGPRMAALSRALAFFAPEIEIVEFPAWDCLPYDRVSPHAAVVAERMAALSRLARLTAAGNPIVVMTTVNAALQRVPARGLIANQSLALAKQKPGELTYGTPGIGTSPHMSMELLKSMAGIELRHIPYRGTAPAVTDVISGQIAVTFANALTARPQVESGNVRALAVSGPKRIEALPDIPPVAEAGVPGYEAMQWYGLLAPAGTPPEILTRLHAEVTQALGTADMKEKLATDGAEAVGTTSAAFAAFITSELDKWTRVARAANIQPQ
jgi:hypothetical protein